MMTNKFGTPEWFKEAEELAKKKRAAVGNFISVRGNVTITTKNRKTFSKNTTTTPVVTLYDYGNISRDGLNGTSYFYDEWTDNADTLVCSSGKDKRGNEETYIYAYFGDRLISKTNTSKGIVIVYEYDKYGRLVTSIANHPNHRMFTNYTYDKMGRLVEEKSQFVTITYEYDEPNMTIKKTIVRSLKDGSTKTIVNTCEYNTDGEFIGETSGALVVERRYDNGACVYEHKTLYGNTISKFEGTLVVDDSKSNITNQEE